MATKAEKLKEKLAAIKAELDAVEKADQEAAERDLIVLARRANCVEELTVIARKKVDAKRKAKGAGAGRVEQ